MRTALLLLALVCATAAKKKDLTQVLELPKEPPPAIAAETRNLTFHVAPLTAKGLLSQQVRDGLKALLKVNSGATIVKIRAFVAGTGDMRRVPALVSEVLTEKHMPLPVVSVVQVGGLPLEGAQVALESISVSRRETSPGGLLFIAAQSASSPEPLSPTETLARQAMGRLDQVLAGAAPLRVTCFTSSLEEAPQLQSSAASHYPQAAVTAVVLQRGASRSTVACEATARLPERDFRMDGHEANSVQTPKVAFTGTQVAFGFEENDARLAFERVEKALIPLGASNQTVAIANFYPLSASIARRLEKIQVEFFNRQLPPPYTNLPFEGLPSIDASFAVDVTAAITR